MRRGVGWAASSKKKAPARARGLSAAAPGSRLAGSPGKDSEEGFDVGVGAGVAVAVEVRRAAGGAAGPAEAGEEGLDVGVGADIAVVVEVGGAGALADGEQGRGAEGLAAVVAGRGL